MLAWYHRWNMALDLQSLFGLLCTAVLIGWDPATPPLPPHLGSYTRALLDSKHKRHLEVGLLVVWWDLVWIFTVKVSREIAQFSPSTLTMNTYWSWRYQDGVMAWHHLAFSATLAVRRSQNPAFSALAASGVLKIQLSQRLRRWHYQNPAFSVLSASGVLKI